MKEKAKEERERRSALKAKNSSIRDLNSDPTFSTLLNMMCKYLQHFNTPNQLHLGLELQGGPSGRELEGVDIEGGGHELGSAGGDVTGGNVHGPERARGRGEELEGAVIVGEGVAVWVAHGHVLEEGEIGGAVEERERWELEGADGDFGVARAEEDEASDDGCDGEED